MRHRKWNWNPHRQRLENHKRAEACSRSTGRSTLDELLELALHELFSFPHLLLALFVLLGGWATWLLFSREDDSQDEN